MASDLDTLLEMGFDKSKAELAVKKSGGLQGALEWLETNQDKSIDELQGQEEDEEQAPALKPGEHAQSLVCNVCGKKFRSQEQAEFHASKTEHVDFSESTEEIAPLTEEEKKARLEELREKLAEKRAGMSQVDKAEQKRNEEIRRKSTKEVAEAKEDLQRKQRLKEAAAQRKEKQDEVAAKERIRQKIKEDQEERKRKNALEKAGREGRAPPPEPTPAQAAPVAAAAGTGTSKPASAYTEARLRLQTPNGNIQKTFPVDTTLFEVASALQAESGAAVTSFTQNFPRKVFSDGADFGQTLKEAGLVPSAVLIVK